jgi:hypothetical protein
MVSDSAADGTRGAVAAKESVVALTAFQVPATGGLSEGMALVLESGAERWTVMAMSVGTFTAPAAGVVETIDKALAGAPAVEAVVAVPPAALVGSDCFKVSVVTTAAMTRTATTREAIHSERCPLGAPACLACVFMAVLLGPESETDGLQRHQPGHGILSQQRVASFRG